MNRPEIQFAVSKDILLPDIEQVTVGIIGLGYVGLPLAAEFGKKFPTLGYDINTRRIDELVGGVDTTKEVSTEVLKSSDRLRFLSCESELSACDILIVAVPTPITASRIPDLKPLLAASEVVGRCIKKGGIVIYESTVYPGATEEDCIPVIEKVSGLRYNIDFFAGYSPERINPGDKERPISKIIKVTSGSTPEVADFVDELYRQIIDAGTFKASSIRVAEAAKIIENTQRDVNIALINELSIIFSNLGIDTNEVLDAASTKWNFIRLRPGLVGGHCIGVDPYYLLHKSIASGFIPDIIRTAREINDGMARNAVGRLVSAMVARDLPVKGARVLVVGFTFKENCPDIRNTKVVDLVAHMRDWGMAPEVVDTWADPEEVHVEYGLTAGTAMPDHGHYDVVVLAVAHEDVVRGGVEALRARMRPDGILFDMKAAFDIADSDLRL
jgi:UDP-N-acetyl-D-glucosamine/UDP-N-acetyl-D-galactosamine dehydrogenase